MVAEGEQVEDLRAVEVAAGRELEPLLACEPGEDLPVGALGGGEDLVGLDDVLPRRREPQGGAGRGTGLGGGLAWCGRGQGGFGDGTPERPTAVPAALVQGRERGVGEPHRTVRAVPVAIASAVRQDSSDAAAARSAARPATRPASSGCPLLAEHGHHVAVRGEAVGVEDRRQPGRRGEPGHVPEALLREVPGEGVDLGADLLDLAAVHGARHQRAGAGGVPGAAYSSITSSSALRQAEQNGTSFRENMMQSTSDR